MRRITRSSSKKQAASPPMSEVSVGVHSTDFLLSMVESRWASRNGDTMEIVPKAQQELEKIEQQIASLQALPGQTDEVQRQVQELSARIEALRNEMNDYRDTWRRIELARHPQRPYTLDYIDRIFTDWSEIHGDRGYADDPAIVCGMARFHGEEVMVIGHQKARETKQKIYRNFGMPNPEGYRKALRTMHIAEKFNRPVITLVDTTGAYPGLGAEERGQAEAIARNLREMARLKIPIITVIIGEGGSGGALAIAVADRVLMLENAIYSVISPESCAAIMWRDVAKKELAAEALRITAKDVSELGCVDAVIPEPEGGAQTDHEAAAMLLDAALQEHLASLKKISLSQLLSSRYDKFRNMAQFFQTVD